MLDLHPFTVQFAVALLLVSVLFDILAMTTDRPHLHLVGWWNLFVGFLASLFAVITGLYAKNNASFTSEIYPVLTYHQWLGIAVAALFTILFVWRSSMQRQIYDRWKTIYISVSIFSAIVLLTTGLLGGQLVFQHGANVEKVKKLRQQIEQLQDESSEDTSGNNTQSE